MLGLTLVHLQRDLQAGQVAGLRAVEPCHGNRREAVAFHLLQLQVVVATFAAQAAGGGGGATINYTLKSECVRGQRFIVQGEGIGGSFGIGWGWSSMNLGGAHAAGSTSWYNGRDFGLASMHGRSKVSSVKLEECTCEK